MTTHIYKIERNNINIVYLYCIVFMASHNSKTMPSRIIGIQFSMLSPEEIRRNSVVEIKTRDTYVNNKAQKFLVINI